MNLKYLTILRCFSDNPKNPTIVVKPVNDTPRRNDTNGDSNNVGEHYKDVKLDKVGELQSSCGVYDDQKWKSNSLTKTRTGQESNNFACKNQPRNPSQRACSSEQSSPQLERRNNQIEPINCINGGSVKDSGIHQKPNGNIESSHGKISSSNVSEFAQVSEDMNELVYHLNSIQNDISELAGKNISLCENQT